MRRVTADGALAVRNVSEHGEVDGRQDPPDFLVRLRRDAFAHGFGETARIPNDKIRDSLDFPELFLYHICL